MSKQSRKNIMKQLVLVASSLPLPQHPMFLMFFPPVALLLLDPMLYLFVPMFTFSVPNWDSQCFIFLVLVASYVPLPHPMFLMLYCWLFSPGAPLPPHNAIPILLLLLLLLLTLPLLILLLLLFLLGKLIPGAPLPPHNAIHILLPYIPIQTQHPHFDVLLHSLHALSD